MEFNTIHLPTINNIMTKFKNKLIDNKNFERNFQEFYLGKNFNFIFFKYLIQVKPI